MYSTGLSMYTVQGYLCIQYSAIYVYSTGLSMYTVQCYLCVQYRAIYVYRTRSHKFHVELYVEQKYPAHFPWLNSIYSVLCSDSVRWVLPHVQYLLDSTPRGVGEGGGNKGR